ncbi:MAG: phosphatase PAP2 family protein [Pseudomonadota bacterium]
MSYFKLRRSRVILGSFLLFSAIMVAFPSIDLSISGFFFDGRSFPRGRWWQDLQQTGLTLFLCLSVSAVLALYVWNRARAQKLGGIDGRRVLYLLLVLGIGPGLIVNTTLKDNFGRARPRNVTEFGGTKEFTAPFVVSRECNTNCSFSSGDAAGGFFALALALALSRRRSVFVAGLAFGTLISLSRIASGAHFFSDTVVSFFVMLSLADVLYHYVVLSQVERTEQPVVAVRAQT